MTSTVRASLSSITTVSFMRFRNASGLPSSSTSGVFYAIGSGRSWLTFGFGISLPSPSDHRCSPILQDVNGLPAIRAKVVAASLVAPTLFLPIRAKEGNLLPLASQHSLIARIKGLVLLKQHQVHQLIHKDALFLRFASTTTLVVLRHVKTLNVRRFISTLRIKLRLGASMRLSNPSRHV